VIFPEHRAISSIPTRRRITLCLRLVTITLTRTRRLTRIHLLISLCRKLTPRLTTITYHPPTGTPTPTFEANPTKCLRGSHRIPNSNNNHNNSSSSSRRRPSQPFQLPWDKSTLLRVPRR